MELPGNRTNREYLIQRNLVSAVCSAGPNRPNRQRLVGRIPKVLPNGQHFTVFTRVGMDASEVSYEMAVTASVSGLRLVSYQEDAMDPEFSAYPWNPLCSDPDAVRY